jgi:hypothetical protein
VKFSCRLKIFLYLGAKNVFKNWHQILRIIDPRAIVYFGHFLVSEGAQNVEKLWDKIGKKLFGLHFGDSFPNTSGHPTGQKNFKSSYLTRSESRQLIN